MSPDVTMLRGRELLICHCSLSVDLSFSAILFYVRENKLVVGHKVLIFFPSVCVCVHRVLVFNGSTNCHLLCNEHLLSHNLSTVSEFFTSTVVSTLFWTHHTSFDHCVL